MALRAVQRHFCVSAGQQRYAGENETQFEPPPKRVRTIRKSLSYVSRARACACGGESHPNGGLVGVRYVTLGLWVGLVCQRFHVVYLVVIGQLTRWFGVGGWFARLARTSGNCGYLPLPRRRAHVALRVTSGTSAGVSFPLKESAWPASGCLAHT